MKTPALVLGLLAAPLLSVPAHAQNFGLDGRTFSVDLGAGVSYGATYPGADSTEASPWIIWRNARFSDSDGTPRDGLTFSPSFGMEGARDADEDPSLAGLGDIDRAYEIGGRIGYNYGQISAQASLRRGFDGHEGLVGEMGVRYRSEVTERLTVWSGLEMGYGDADYRQTYFGVSSDQAAASGYREYRPGGGFNSVAATLEARYALTELTAVLGEVRYGRLIGDAADSPIVQDKEQPQIRLGVVRRFSFGF